MIKHPAVIEWLIFFSITSKPPHIISRMGIAYLPQINNVFANLKIKSGYGQSNILFGVDFEAIVEERVHS